ncbi:hypothetical protein H9P43_005751 [Blastocladiella emersonii ATCC 22665]|nr:hypothetical protein H9P43_005751 [Blastocladiella emersonii ATCC 22665]
MHHQRRATLILCLLAACLLAVHASEAQLEITVDSELGSRGYEQGYVVEIEGNAGFGVLGVVVAADGEPLSAVWRPETTPCAEPGCTPAIRTFAASTVPPKTRRFTIESDLAAEVFKGLLQIKFNPDFQTCGGGNANGFFVPLVGEGEVPLESTVADAARVCQGAGGELAAVDVVNVLEVTDVATKCVGGTKRVLVGSWSGINYGLGALVLTTPSARGVAGTISSPLGEALPVLCKRRAPRTETVYGTLTATSTARPVAMSLA